MRPAGKSESAKLYDTYPLLQSPPDRASLSNRAPVAILGAGPIRMTAVLVRSSMQMFERPGAVSGKISGWKTLGWTTGRAGTILL